MSNTATAFHIPTADGPAASINTAGLNAIRTLVVYGNFPGATVVIEASNDNATWVPVAIFQRGGSRTLSCSALWMRVSATGIHTATRPFVVMAHVAAVASTSSQFSIPMPAGGDGYGTAVDISTLPNPELTLIVGGSFDGATVHIEISEDNVGFSEIAGFDGAKMQNPVNTALWMRTNVTGRRSQVPFSALASVSSSATPGGGGGGGGGGEGMRYIVSGGEASLSDFMVPLAVARATDVYRVTATLSGVAIIVDLDCPDILVGDRTTTHFRVVSTFPFTAGDQIDFIVADALS